MQVNILEAKNQLSRLVKRALAGEEIIIANRGQPVAKLTAATAQPRVKAGHAGGIAGWLERNPLPAGARRTGAAIDAAIAEERHTWATRMPGRAHEDRQPRAAELL